MTHKRNRFLAVLAALALALGGATSIAVAESDSATGIEGSWLCTVGTAPQAFTAIQSFTAGGVALATGSNDRVFSVSVPLGSWKQIGRRRFALTADLFSYDPAGNAVAMFKNNQVYQLKKWDELEGVSEFNICDVQGQNCAAQPGLSPISCKRIRVEKLTAE